MILKYLHSNYRYRNSFQEKLVAKRLIDYIIYLLFYLPTQKTIKAVKKMASKFKSGLYEIEISPQKL